MRECDSRDSIEAAWYDFHPSTPHTVTFSGGKYLYMLRLGTISAAGNSLEREKRLPYFAEIHSYYHFFH